jgi:hypothetical protein
MNNQLRGLWPVTVLALLLSASFVLAAPASSDLMIPGGTEVRLHLSNPLSASDVKELREDDKMYFSVVQDVVVDDVIIIKAGAKAWASVTEANGRGKFGKGGKLRFTFRYVDAVNGQNISISGTGRAEGADNHGKAAVVVGGLAVVTGGVGGAIGGLFVHGKPVEISTDREWTANIEGDRRIALAPAASMTATTRVRQ